MGAESRMVIFSYLNILMASAFFQFSTWAEENSVRDRKVKRVLINFSSHHLLANVQNSTYDLAAHKLQLGANVHRNDIRVI